MKECVEPVTRSILTLGIFVVRPVIAAVLEAGAKKAAGDELTFSLGGRSCPRHLFINRHKARRTGNPQIQVPVITAERNFPARPRTWSSKSGRPKKIAEAASRRARLASEVQAQAGHRRNKLETPSKTACERAGKAGHAPNEQIEHLGGGRRASKNTIGSASGGVGDRHPARLQAGIEKADPAAPALE